MTEKKELSPSEIMRAAAQRLYGPKPDGKLHNDHTVTDMPDYKPKTPVYTR